MPVWDHLLERLPGSWGSRDGHGFSLGHTPAASLPACDARRRGEMRRVDSEAGVADRVVVCMKDAADAYDWLDVTVS